MAESATGRSCVWPRTDAEQAAQQDPGIIGAPAPVTGFPSISEIVALARAEVRRTGQPPAWVPGEDDPDASVQSLAALMDSTQGSGHLTWGPNAGSGTIRTDGTVAGTAHRHFPDPDVPYLASPPDTATSTSPSVTSSPGSPTSWSARSGACTSPARPLPHPKMTTDPERQAAIRAMVDTWHQVTGSRPGAGGDDRRGGR